MKTKIISTIVSLISILTAGSVLTVAFALVSVYAAGVPAVSTTAVNASINTSVSASASATTTLTAAQLKAQAKLLAKDIALGDKDITQRIATLNGLVTRISQMVKVSSNEKANLDSEIQGQITTLAALKVKIDADTDPTILKADDQSITDAYRIYLLVVPQTEILAAADRMGTIVDAMTVLAPKLQAGITAAQTAGDNTVTMQAAFSDYNAKVADATTQYQTAGNVVAVLQPDNGSTTIAVSNHQSLLAARADIKTGTADLVAARKDAGTIATALKGLHINTSASATATATTTVTTASTTTP